MDLQGGRVEDVKQLKADTMEKQKDMLELATALKELDKMLQTNAKGFSMDPLYEKVPDCLRGYVELCYDLNNNPSYRLFESLLYNSRYYKPDSQSIALWITDNDERPFCLSTPRLNEDNVLHLDIPFKHAGIDQLSKMKRTPGSLEEITRVLGIQEKDAALFATFFTTEAPAPYKKYTGDKIRMRYFGHACILVETKDLSILLDPIISYYGYQTDVSRFSDVDLPDVIDYVLITHNHQDHILFETLLPLRHKIRNLVIPRSGTGSLQDPSLKLMFQKIGFNNLVTVDEMETITFHDCTITGIPFIGEHSDLNIQTKLCYNVKVGQFNMMFVADSCNVDNKLYEHVQQLIGDIDILFLGMECDGAPLTWLYGPLLTEELARDKDQSRRLAGSNYERGKALVEIFHPQEVYVYAMGQEPWLEFISSIKYTEDSNPIVASNKLISYCRDQALTAERLFGEKELYYDKKTALVAG